jgi:Protein of unknown function (DUF4058)
MASPFPGMNPYLEHPDRWSTVHNRLIVALADVLTPQLLPKYQVDIEKRVYEVIGTNTLLVGRPDVTVQQPRNALPSATSVAVSIPSEPVKVNVPLPEEVREAYLEIKEAATQLVITAIEILSPANKRSDGRKKYEQKRQQVLGSQTHLVEIDLLRDGEPMPILATLPSSRYRILVSQSDTRPTADLYPFDLTDPIPKFPLPLQRHDAPPVIDLQALLNQVYERSGYDYFINYQQNPLPPLSEAELAWIDDLLHSEQLR